MITSVKNPAVMQVKSLLKKTTSRKEQGLFVCEGKRLFFDMAGSGASIKSVFVTESFLKDNPKLRDTCEKYEVVSDNVLSAMSDTKTPQGVVALIKQPEWSEKDIFSRDNPLLLILDSVSDPGNIGTIFRSFEACGGSGIIMTHNCADITSPKCVRSTMGSFLRLPYIIADSPNAVKKLLAGCAPQIRIFAADLTGADYTTKDYRGACAFIIGNEAKGISDEAKSIASDTISIPMEGRVESLNAAVSAAILGFEAARQRKV